MDFHIRLLKIKFIKMKKTYFIPRAMAKKLLWITNFNTKVIFHASTLGILAPALLILLNDTNAFTFIMALKTSVKKYAMTISSFLFSLANGPLGTAVAPYPMLGAATTLPPAVAYGIFARCAIMAKQIKANGCSDEIALDLGIVGSDIANSFALSQPVLKLLILAGIINGKYTRGQLSGIHLECMRGTETVFTFLLTANKASFKDERPNLIAGQAETRHYRAWFILNDEVVGVVSSIVTISIAA